MQTKANSGSEWNPQERFKKEEAAPLNILSDRSVGLNQSHADAVQEGGGGLLIFKQQSSGGNVSDCYV